MNSYAKRMMMTHSNKDYRRDYRDYADGEDMRQGVKGTGAYGIGGRLHDRRDHADGEDMYYARDRRDYRERDYRDYADGNDYAEARLTKRDLEEWKHKTGEHFTLPKIEELAHKVGARYDDYTEKELCMTANMLYSDFGKMVKKYINQDVEPMFFVDFAKTFLEDPDASATGSEKLAIYYYGIAMDDEQDKRR